METKENNPEEMHCSGETNTSSNIASSEIDKETASKLRGDAIGDTMYSEVFVLNTLMQFSDLHWSSEVEDNLCFLWDMTEEKDVCQYLFQVSFPELACTAVTNYNEPRFIEIVVGIFANILCSSCEKNIKDDEIKTILNLLNSNDPYILIQIMRFIHAISFMFDKLLFITDEHLDRFNFILYNSTNKELLVLTLKTISSITSETKLDKNVINGELLPSAITACKVVKDDAQRESEFEMFESQEQHIVIKYLIQFVCNLCCYVDNFKNIQLVNELNSYLHEFTEEMGSLLNYYTIEKNLLHIDEEFKFYLEALTYIYKILGASYTSTIVVPLCRIMFVLMKCSHDNLEIVGNLDCLKEDFQALPSPQLKHLFTDIEKSAFNFEFDYLSNLRQIIQHQSVKYDLFPLSPLSRHRLSIVKRKVLVLDLDETLIHSHHDGVVRQTVRPGTPPDFVLKVVIDRHPVRFFVHKRPHVDFFLDIVSQWYELVVFTASMEIYGAAVADKLDAGRGILQRRFYRQHCTPDLGSYTKDLGAICNDLSSVFILDNSPGAYRAYPDNAIPIKSWFSDPTDVALLNLLPVLDALRFTADVRSVLSRNLHLHRLW
ncbi:CTD nuclear envelope phosphatase 1 -like [Asbolus verrucosus]|uniref:CTD nuclear envelope phosphatase 1 homolog n=1 Tax=Asbolus verrucosus TaxID=1661398 RepID=A0A482VR23_ASBVE|nr:CTD nuclear envelope phosphatase 1 -like [Asbolus verrucosus]